jgi:hypothetical protein
MSRTKLTEPLSAWKSLDSKIVQKPERSRLAQNLASLALNLVDHAG